MTVREAIELLGQRFVLKYMREPQKTADALEALEYNEEYGVFVEHVPTSQDAPLVVVPDEKTYIALVSKVQVKGILNLGGLVSAVENKQWASLNHKPLGKHKIAILMFPDTPEADVTEQHIKAEYPHLNVHRVQYGIPRTLKITGLDEETILKSIGL